MNMSHIVVGLMVGTAIGAIDFSLARSMAAMVRPSSARFMQAILLGGFAFRLGLIGVVLWLLSRSGGINFMAVCIGLVLTFTAMTIGHAVTVFRNTARTQTRTSNRR